MRINNNITALNAHRQYTNNNTAIGKNVAKLSSGYRINSAADDAAGLAISEKMRAQIRGLNMASKNSQDGISLVQTAEGALQSTHDILQRMRELAVQSSSDTNETTIDRAALQQEFKALMDEINDISTTTRFNDQNLLDGTFQKIKSSLNNTATNLQNVKSLSVARAGAGSYTMNVTSTAANDPQITPGAATQVFEDGLLNIASAANKVDTVSFTGLETSAHNGNTYELQVEGATAEKMTFRLVDTNGDVVATAHNVDTTKWNTANNSANTVKFDGVGTFTFSINEAIIDPTDLSSMTGEKITFFADDMPGFKHTITMELPAAGDFDAVLGAIVAELDDSNSNAPELSIAYEQPASTFDVLSPSSTAPVYSFEASTDKNGMLTIAVKNANGQTMETKKVSTIGLAANGDDGDSVEIDLGKYGKFTITNEDSEITALKPAAEKTFAASGLSTGTVYVGGATKGGTVAVNDVSAATTVAPPGGEGTALPIGNISIASIAGATNIAVKSTTVVGDGSTGFKAGNVVFTIDMGDLGTFEHTVTIGATQSTASAFEGLLDAGLKTFAATLTEGPGTPEGSIAPTTATSTTTSTAAPAVAADIEGGKEQLTTTATRAFLTLDINGESVNLYKGDTYANFANQGISFQFNELSDADVLNANYFGSASVTISVNATQGADLIIQSGANQGDETTVNIDRISTETLGLSYSNIAKQKSASSAITEVNDALNQVSTQRAALGALQNRLEFKIANLDTSAENLTAAESRIRDVDMAKEMTEFTKNNIRSQAATAMLAQANALPQGVLQLLG